MSTEKTPTLYMEKGAIREYESKHRLCSKTTLSWVFAAFLVALLVVVTIQFLYPAVDDRLRADVTKVRILDDSPIDVRVIETDHIFTDPSYQDKESGRTIPWDLDFLIDPAQICATRNPPDTEMYQNDPEIKMLMIVSSATDHFRQRAAIRNTWGSVADKPGGAIKLAFILGTTMNETEQQVIFDESKLFHDIIQVDFDDTYRSLTTKSILMLKWVAKRCPHAQYFLKADDDTFVNIGIVGRILGREPFKSEDKFIGGYIHSGAQPIRDMDEKYYVSEDEYSLEEYPPYASGSAYVTTGPTAAELFEASRRVQPMLPMEDVFITGLCGQEIGAKLLHEPRFTYDNPPNPPSWESFSSLASVHSVLPDVLEQIWDEMSKSILNFLYQQEALVNASSIARVRR